MWKFYLLHVQNKIVSYSKRRSGLRSSPRIFTENARPASSEFSEVWLNSGWRPCLKPNTLFPLPITSSIVTPPSRSAALAEGGLLLQKQRVGCAQSAYLQGCHEFPAAIVVETVAAASSRFNKVQQAVLQVAETKAQSCRVSTGDPMCPRQVDWEAAPRAHCVSLPFLDHNGTGCGPGFTPGSNQRVWSRTC